MKVRFSPYFYKQYKKANVRIRNRVDQAVAIFTQNPNDLELNNHLLNEPYQDFRSIDITADWRALYEEMQIGEETFAYFVELGTHDALYGKDI